MRVDGLALNSVKEFINHGKWRSIIGAAMLVLAAGVYFDLWPLYKTGETISGKINFLSSQLARLASHESLMNDHSVKRTAIIERHQPDPLIQLVTSMAYQSGMILSSFHAEPMDDESGFFSDRATCRLHGGYAALTNALFRLFDLSNGLFLRHFFIDAKTLQDYELTIEIYRLNWVFLSQVKNENGIHARQVQSNPFCGGHQYLLDGRENVMNQALKLVSINELQVAGLVRQGNDRAAWLRQPSGHILVVRPGEVIGQEAAQVKFISDDCVILQHRSEKKICVDGRDDNV